MYLHVGNGKNLRESKIIGIFDADTATVSPITRKFLSSAERSGLVESAVEEIPKSFVLYDSGVNNYKICFSQISTSALVGRIQNGE